eukprot:g42692.t1
MSDYCSFKVDALERLNVKSLGCLTRNSVLCTKSSEYIRLRPINTKLEKRNGLQEPSEVVCVSLACVSSCHRPVAESCGTWGVRKECGWIFTYSGARHDRRSSFRAL